MVTIKLIAGELDNDSGELTPGTMSWEIDKALSRLVRIKANEDPRGRRKLALAIARGVITHLRDRQAAFTVTLRAGVVRTVRIKAEV